MATPRADTYSAASGAGVYAGIAGPSGMPAWRTAMAPLTWAVVPVSRTLAQVDPASNPALNPNYPAAAPWASGMGQAGALDAWCSLVPSPTDGVVRLPIGGGHGDYNGNEMYDIDLAAESPAWRLVRRPTGSLPEGAAALPGGSSYGLAGTWPDGRICSPHTYNTMCYVPGYGTFVSDNVSNYTIQGPQKAWWISDTGEHSLACDYSHLPLAGDHGASCHDTLRNVVWFTRKNTLSKIAKFDPATGVATAHGYIDTWASNRLVYIPGADLVLSMNYFASSGLALFRPSDEAWKRNLTVVGAAPAWLRSANSSGAAWVPSRGQLVMWNNTAANTTSFATLTPGADPFNDPWTWGQLDAAAGNSVTPVATIDSSNGELANTYGKCSYLPYLNGFYCQVSHGSPMYFFALD